MSKLLALLLCISSHSSSVTRKMILITEMHFEEDVMTSSVAKINFLVAEVTFKVAVIIYLVVKIAL